MTTDLGVKRIVFKEILPGDRRKSRAESHDAKSGGGARDLRFRPYGKFRAIFEKLLPTVDENDILFGHFYWFDDGELVTSNAEFHPETTSRKNEGRLSNIDKYLPVDKMPHESEGTTFVLLIQDEEGKVWPSFATEDSLLGEEWDPRVSDKILESHAKKRYLNRTTSGYIDFETNEVFCNHG